jgi:hypothetical protein
MPDGVTYQIPPSGPATIPDGARLIPEENDENAPDVVDLPIVHEHPANQRFISGPRVIAPFADALGLL